jgi:hypothetical protein
LSGTVVDGSSNQPLSGVEVTLQTENWKDIGDPAVSDGQGRFAFGGLPAGEYILSAEGPTFGTIHYGEAPDPGWVSSIRVGGEGGDKSVVFRIVPRGAVEGVVRDEFGDPMVAANVSSVRPLWRDGRRTMATVNGGSTDDRGRYRLGNLMPGNYLVCIAGWQNAAPAPVPGSLDYAARVDNRFYSRTCSRPLQLAPGQHAQVDLSPFTASTATVRGHVRGLPAQTGFNVTLSPEDDSAGFNQPFNGFVDMSQASFTLRGVPPGRYRLHAQSYSNTAANPSKPMAADIPVEVGGSDIDNLDISLDAGGTLDVAVAGEISDGSVSLRSADASRGSRGAPRNKDGIFHFDNLSPGRYWLDVRPSAGNCVQSVTLGDKDVTGKPIQMEAGNALHFAVALSATCGSIRMRAVRDGAPVPGAKVVLLLNGTPQEPGALKEDFTDDEGEFLFSGLAPGHYLVWSWAVAGKGAIAGPASLAAVERQAIAVEVTAGGPVQVEVPLLADEGSGQ